MSDIGRKDAAIGLLIMGLVAMAGWVGFLYMNPITKTKTEEDEETIYIYSTTEVPLTYDSGLPDDWSTAPNASKIILHNETGDRVEITLGQILEYVEKWEETDPDTVGNEGKKYWWEKRLEPLTVNDASGVPITGVDVLELLRVFDCNFAGELEFVSHNATINKLRMDVIDICDILDNDNNFILGIAADKKWLKNSPIADDDSGDFVILSRDITYYGETNITETWEYSCYDLANITVTKNWTITVNVYNNTGYLNQTLELDAFNITNAYDTKTYHYEYENTDWWNFNRSYYATNVSKIVGYTKANGTNYVLNFTFADGGSQPFNNSYRDETSRYPYFNYTEVEDHLRNNVTHIVGNHIDLVNGNKHMNATNLKMCITNDIQFGYEEHVSKGYYNSPWDQYYNYGYPPFQLIIPGCTKSRYFNGLTEITITIISDSR